MPLSYIIVGVSNNEKEDNPDGEYLVTKTKENLRGPLLVNIFLDTQKLLVALCSCILIAKNYQFSCKLTFFFVTLLLPSFLGRYSLVYHESLRIVLFPVVYILKFICCAFLECVLNIFSTSCGFFFVFK